MVTCRRQRMYNSTRPSVTAPALGQLKLNGIGSGLWRAVTRLLGAGCVFDLQVHFRIEWDL